MSSSPRYLSLDVECVADGLSHDDRTVCSAAVVDYDENTMLYELVKPDKPVVSYLTPITGFSKGDLDGGKSLSTVIENVKSCLGPAVVLIGQNIQSDINWLGLEKGKDFKDYVELADMFATRHPRYGDNFKCSLKHKADVLIRRGLISEPHSPIKDAVASIKLFKKYEKNPAKLRQDVPKLAKGFPEPSIGKVLNFEYDGVCLAAFNPQKCICNAPTKRGT